MQSVQPAFQFESKIGITKRSDLVVSSIFLALHTSNSPSSMLQCKTWRKKKGKLELTESERQFISKTLISFG